jgi:hypothetical protein
MPEAPTWTAVALATVNGVQLVALAYIGVHQARSTRERIRRTAVDELERHNGSTKQ